MTIRTVCCRDKRALDRWMKRFSEKPGFYLTKQCFNIYQEEDYFLEHILVLHHNMSNLIRLPF